MKMRITIIIILVFVVGFIVGQTTHIYTITEKGIRLNTITGDITTISDLYQAKRGEY